jgi:hypothetical protein
MVVYVKDKNGVYKTLKELSADYNVSLKLMQGRYTNGVRDVKDLTQPKHDMLRK